MAINYRVVERTLGADVTLTEFENEISDLINKEGWIPLGGIRMEEWDTDDDIVQITASQTLWRPGKAQKRACPLRGEDWR